MSLNPNSSIARAKNKARRFVTIASRPRSRQRVVVTLTSYPQRIRYVPQVVRSLFAQRELADLIVLYLSRDQFPGMERDLPADLLACRGFDFQIRWVSGDMKSHKKYLYAFEDFPGDLLITVDDDIVCRNTLVGDLLAGFRKYPECVIAIRAHGIRVSRQGRVLPYADWEMQVSDFHPEVTNFPSMALFATSGAGLLLPPGCLPEASFDERAIRDTCLNADDIWLKAMTAIGGFKTVAVPGPMGVFPIEGSQDSSLWLENSKGGNDRAMALVRDYCESVLGVESLDALLADEELAALIG